MAAARTLRLPHCPLRLPVATWDPDRHEQSPRTAPQSQKAQVATSISGWAQVATSPLVAPAPPCAPKTTVQTAAPDRSPRFRFASAHGTDDRYCHWLVSRARTLCGETIDPPLENGSMHRSAPCPNGHEPCPDCVRIAGERGQR